jgi:uncharacterized protein (TIGR02453 family)
MKDSTIQFLKDLSKNNNRDWFTDNKNQYLDAQNDVITFVEKLIQGIGNFDESILKIDAKKSLFRIYRDVRFSHDKSPYKTNFGASLGIGKGSQKAGYYLHIEPGKSFIAAGIYMPDAPTLKKVRTEISENGKEFLKIVNNAKFKKEFGDLDSESALKKIPQGFDKEDPMAEYLKLKNFVVIKKISDKELLEVKAAENLVSLFKEAKPFNDFINLSLED